MKETSLATTPRYAIPRFKSISLNDFLSSCLATNGHTTQLTATAATTPMTSPIPSSDATSAADWPASGWLCAVNETIVKLKQVIKPERGWDESINRKTVLPVNKVYSSDGC